LEQSIFHRLSRLLWGLIVTLIVLLAIYVSAGRLLVSNLGQYQESILRLLSARLPFAIDAQRVSGEWHSFTPVIVMTGLRLAIPGSGGQVIELAEGRAGLDMAASLRTRSLQVTALQLEGLQLQGELTGEGRLLIRGLSEGGGDIGRWLREFLLNAETITLSDNRLDLALPSGEVRALALGLRMQRERSRRRLVAELLSERGTQIRASATGVGDPFRPELFNGDVYLDIRSGRLEDLEHLLVNRPQWLGAEGNMDLQMWLAWDRGGVGVEARVEARDLLIADRKRAWQLPLERLALEASLRAHKRHWTLFAADVQMENGGVAARIPRLQLDQWGQSLRLRAADVDLAPVSALAAGLEQAPAPLGDVLGTMAPRGRVAAVQLSVADVAAPGADWGLQARFEDVAVDPWREAPGVTSATGYIELAPGTGTVVLDSRDISLAFPHIFREPLRYDDLYGTLQLVWDAGLLRLSSGAITARAAEGTARALFALHLPLAEGSPEPEMELLVGLRDSHPLHRSKYLPQLLNEPLRKWLAGSIGEGRVVQSGFLWRGSLRREAERLRTVQLFFDVADTSLDYYPGWPPMSGLDGVVLIDDTNASIWLERARVLSSQVEQLSAEAGLNEAGEMVLDLDGWVHGPAADALAVINGPVLRERLGDAFAGWQLEGRQQSHLQLRLNLTDSSVPPEVAVETLWQEVKLQIADGPPVEAINGKLRYSSARGFSSEELAGVLWGRPVTARVSQGGSAPYDPARSPVVVDLAATPAMGELRHWLDLEPLALARGRTAVAARLSIPPGAPAQLTLRSDLAGLRLDLPAPWGKAASEKRPLRLEMPLGNTGARLLRLSLAEALHLHLELLDGAVRSGALAFGKEPTEMVPGVLRVTGRTPLLDAQEWRRVATSYFGGLRGGGGERDSGSPTAAPAAPSLALVVDDLRIDALLLRGQTLQDVMLSLAEEGAQWRLQAATEWLRGQLLLSPRDARSRLDIDFLDLDRLPLQDRGAPAESSPFELPPMAVRLADLRRGGRALGELAFALQARDGLLTAEGITGEIAGIRLPAGRDGRLAWRQKGGTELDLSLAFGDMGKTLARIGYERTVETERGLLDLSLQWPGAPWDFSLAQGRGSLRVDIGPGRFLEASAGTSGALRVVSILNLADLVKRLSLTSMFESGIPFDSVTGEALLRGGTIEVPRMDVRGSSSRFQFSGISGVAMRSLEGELVATLPVASNLPWVAALAGGLPVAAGVFVVSKVFEKQVNRLSSAIYSIRGTWDDPAVRFQRIFDDSAGRPGESGTGAAPQLEAPAPPSRPPAPLPPVQSAPLPPSPGLKASEK
jgi:uncharacterized protein (TIGR02099 family)